MIFTQKELYEVSKFYEKFHLRLKHFAEDASNFRRLQREIAICFDKNSTVLQSNIIGKQLLVNKKTEDNILAILNITREELSECMENSEYFQKFGKLRLEDQILFAIPLIILTGEYLKLRKREEAKFVYLFAFFKPYASIISKYFPYGVNDDRMRYTIEIALTDKSDIRKLGTVSNMLFKKAEVSLENHAEELSRKITDRELHVIYTSGIQSRLNNSIAGLEVEYRKNKDSYLPFESSSFQGEDDGRTEYIDKNIESDSAVKSAISRKAVAKLSNGQIDMKAIDAASQVGFGTISSHYQTLLKNLIADIVEKMSDKFFEFFECLVGSVLFHINPETGRKYTGKDLTSPVFLTAALSIFSKKNVKDKNTIRTRELVNEMLSNCSPEFLAAGKTKKDQLRKALYFYFVIICRLGG